jgi:hypothetical protein
MTVLIKFYDIWLVLVSRIEIVLFGIYLESLVYECKFHVYMMIITSLYDYPYCFLWLIWCYSLVYMTTNIVFYDLCHVGARNYVLGCSEFQILNTLFFLQVSLPSIEFFSKFSKLLCMNANFMCIWCSSLVYLTPNIGFYDCWYVVRCTLCVELSSISKFKF